MSIKNDRWSALSMSERADLMNMYITNDISDLKEMKKHYNSFSGEEDTNNNTKSELQKRLYDGVFPWSYKYPIVRTSLALLGHKTQPDEFRDDIWAEYLNIPQEERHNIDSPKVVTSKYSPTIDGDSSIVYKTLSKIPQHYIDALVQQGNNLKYNQSKTSPVLEYYFGDHTISKGHDDEGSYVSYYDLWNIAPFFKKGDESMGVGNPISFYDRVYLDDYYDIPEAFRGNPYIAPAVLTDTNAYVGTE